MKSLSLIIDNNPSIVQVERYFLSHGNAYLIYSTNDKDVDGNVKIYVAKIDENQKVVTIDSSDEWDQIKKDIVNIVNDNKECCKLSVEDLDFSNLNNLEITSAKALRLPSAVMPYLSTNQPQFSHLTLEQQEQKLDEKAQSLKEINQDLTALMGEVEKQFPQVPIESEEVTPSTNSDMEATMEIIMPNTETSDASTEAQETKEKFRFKNLFGKKKEKSIPVVEQTEEIPVTPADTNGTIVEQTDLPEPTPIEPIPVEEAASLEIPRLEKQDIHQKTMDLINTPVNENIDENNKELEIEPLEKQDIYQRKIDLANSTSSENIEDSNTQVPEVEQLEQIELPTLPETDEEIATPDLSVDSIFEPVVETPNTSESKEKTNTIEILNVEQDEYEQEYELLKSENKRLNEKISELEQELQACKEKLEQVKNIVE